MVKIALSLLLGNVYDDGDDDEAAYQHPIFHRETPLYPQHGMR